MTVNRQIICLSFKIDKKVDLRNYKLNSLSSVPEQNCAGNSWKDISRHEEQEQDQEQPFENHA